MARCRQEVNPFHELDRLPACAGNLPGPDDFCGGHTSQGCRRLACLSGREGYIQLLAGHFLRRPVTDGRRAVRLNSPTHPPVIPSTIYTTISPLLRSSTRAIPPVLGGDRLHKLAGFPRRVCWWGPCENRGNTLHFQASSARNRSDCMVEFPEYPANARSAASPTLPSELPLS